MKSKYLQTKLFNIYLNLYDIKNLISYLRNLWWLQGHPSHVIKLDV